MTAHHDDELADPRIAALLEHADKLLVGASASSRVRQNVARARHAYGQWREASGADDVRHWRHVVGSRALAAALATVALVATHQV